MSKDLIGSAPEGVQKAAEIPFAANGINILASQDYLQGLLDGLDPTSHRKQANIRIPSTSIVYSHGSPGFIQRDTEDQGLALASRNGVSRAVSEQIQAKAQEYKSTLAALTTLADSQASDLTKALVLICGGKETIRFAGMIAKLDGQELVVQRTGQYAFPIKPPKPLVKLERFLTNDARAFFSADDLDEALELWFSLGVYKDLDGKHFQFTQALFAGTHESPALATRYCRNIFALTNWLTPESS